MEMAKIQEVGIQIDDNSETYVDTNQEITEVAIQTDGQLENYSTETNQVGMTGEDVAVSVDKLQIYMKEKLGELPGGPNRSVTIFRLPGWMRENNKQMCEPKLVSIGPYYHGRENLQTMEEHKWYVLRNFLAYNENVNFEVYLQAMRSIEAEVRNCYSETVDLTSDEFVMMLLLDGCFMLEYLLNGEFNCQDAIFGTGWGNSNLLYDMILLENQLPFSVIHKLFSLANQHKGLTCLENCKSDQCLPHLLLRGLERYPCIIGPYNPPELSCSDIYHFLHLYYICTVPDFQSEIEKEAKKIGSHKLQNVCGFGSVSWSKLFSRKSMGISDSEFIPVGMNTVTIQCVAELHDAGIKFKRKEKPRSLLDISFKNGIIEMPFLHCEPISVGILWNMAAFEQSLLSLHLPQTISSYLALMDSLINTEKDFAMLERFNIVNNFFQNPEEASTFFNKFDIYFLLDYDDHYFGNLFKKIKEYSESTWHKHRARLMQDYFSNPWTIISVVAAGILLILTIVQTYFSAPK